MGDAGEIMLSFGVSLRSLCTSTKSRMYKLNFSCTSGNANPHLLLTGSVLIISVPQTVDCRAQKEFLKSQCKHRHTPYPFNRQQLRSSRAGEHLCMFCSSWIHSLPLAASSSSVLHGMGTVSCLHPLVRASVLRSPGHDGALSLLPVPALCIPVRILTELPPKSCWRYSL